MTIQPKRSGKLLLKVRSISGIIGEMNIDVPKPAIDQIVFSKTPSKLYVGTVTQFMVKVFDKAKIIRDDVDFVLISSDPSLADFDNFGNLKAKNTGRVTLSARVGAITEKLKVRIVKNPVRSLSLDFEKDQIRTGDV